jgi:hypothetical protein
MRIALRTSGGRGEYEMSGSHGDISVADVIDHNIFFQIFPGKFIDSKNWIRRLQGKPRIRLGDPSTDKHLYLSLADVLLMPKPIRELGKTPGGKLQLTANNYSIISIQFDVVNHKNKQLRIQPTDLVLGNSDNDVSRIDVLERLRIILDIWDEAAKRCDLLSGSIRNHRDAVLSGDLKSIQFFAHQLRSEFIIEDPLREIIREFSLINEYTYWVGTHRDNVELTIIDNDITPPEEAIVKRIKEWRLQASRGSKGARFSKDVKSAYRNKCLFTGYYLPKSEFCNTAGVDSAHILPWAQYDINSVNNGLCLNKLCHWAFDNGILILRYISSQSAYELSISDKAIQAGKSDLLSLEGFHPLTGLIPESRLPDNKKDWPSPKYLEEYNLATKI